MFTRRSSLAAVLFASGVLFSAGTARAQDIADITDGKGDITVQDAAGASRKVTRIGTTSRYLNGKIKPGEQIVTGGDGSATLKILRDGSLLKVSPGTKFSITEGRTADMKLAGGLSTTRSIKIAVGKVWGDIQPSKAVFTQFDTPSGVAAVRGTVVEVGFSVAGQMSVSCSAGTVGVLNPMAGLSLNLGQGQGVQVTSAQPGAVTASPVTVTVTADGGTQITGTVGAVSVSMNGTDSVQATGTAGTTNITVVSGAIDAKAGGAAIKMDTGDGVQATTQAGGDAAISTTAGTVEVTVGNQQATLTTGNAVNVNVTGTTASVQVTSGPAVAVVNTDTGAQSTTAVGVSVEATNVTIAPLAGDVIVPPVVDLGPAPVTTVQEPERPPIDESAPTGDTTPLTDPGQEDPSIK